MSGEKINLTKGGGEESIFKIPKEVYNANWRDDITEEAEEEKESLGDFEEFKNESDYQHDKSETAKQSTEADNIERKLFLENRPLMRRLGRIAYQEVLKETA